MQSVGLTDGLVAPPEAALEPARQGEPARPVSAGWRFAGACALVGLLGVALPVLLAQHYGALGIARNDDWSYLDTLFRWVQDGHLDFNSWVSMTLLSQLLLAAPVVWLFGRAITLVQLETALIGFGGLCLVVWLGRAVIGKLWKGTFVALLVAAGPLWGALAVSFMTDVPAFAVSMLACALGVAAIRRPTVSVPLAGASMAVGVVAFTIRQYAAVPPVAIGLVALYLLARDHNRRGIRNLVLTGAALFAAALTFWLYWRTIPHPKAFTFAVPSGHSVRATLYKGTGMARLVGLLVAPAILLANPVAIVRRSWQTAKDTTVFAFTGVVAVLAFTATSGPNIAFAGNYITPDGILAQGVVGGERPALFPTGVFTALIVIGTLAAGLLALTIVPLVHQLPRRRANRDFALRDPAAAFLGLTIAGYAAAYLLASIADIPMYDRYVLPVVPLIAILVLRTPAHALDPMPAPTRRGALVAGAVGLAVLAFVGYMFAADSAAFDGSRWSVATEATHAGWRRTQIRGGFEWTNYHWGRHIPAKRRFCVEVRLDPDIKRDDPRVVAYGYYRAPFHDPVPVVALRSNLPCTPKAAS